MNLVKRWAFAPLVVICLVMLGGSVSHRLGHSLLVGNIVGLVVAIPVSMVIAHRRRLRTM